MTRPAYVQLDTDRFGTVTECTFLSAADLPNADEARELPLTTTIWAVRAPDRTGTTGADLVYDAARSRTYSYTDPEAWDLGDEALFDFRRSSEYFVLRTVEAELIHLFNPDVRVGLARPGTPAVVLPLTETTFHAVYRGLTEDGEAAWVHCDPHGDLRVLISLTDLTGDHSPARTVAKRFLAAVGR